MFQLDTNSLDTDLQSYLHTKDTHTSAYPCCFTSTTLSNTLCCLRLQLIACARNRHDLRFRHSTNSQHHHHRRLETSNLDSAPGNTVLQGTHMDGVRKVETFRSGWRAYEFDDRVTVDVVYPILNVFLFALCSSFFFFFWNLNPMFFATANLAC